VENNKAVKKPVVTGESYNLNVEILQGLSSGEQIVVEGQMLLEPDAKVKIIE
jgi:multidrug efflux pump subunit AcrA (membrane-fusion protein)